MTLHAKSHGNADLAAHFFRRAFGFLRQGGAFGLIATNTICQGDTRASGLTSILGDGGAILRATRRLKWPGEAAVVVSVVHVVKGEIVSAPVLDDKLVQRISAYLVEGDLDTSPVALVANSGLAFKGSFILGMGFTFDDVAAAKGEAESLEAMRALIAKNPKNAERIFPFIGGAEVNTSPTHAHHRYVINFSDFPLRRDANLKSWGEMNTEETARCRTTGIVPADYKGEVAEDWPDLLEIVRSLVKPERDKNKLADRRIKWWKFANTCPGLYTKITTMDRVLATNCKASSHLSFSFLDRGSVFAHSLVIAAFSSFAPFATLQSRVHEVWARFFSSSLKDDLAYAPSDCFRTFPFPAKFETDATLEAAGEAYHVFRAQRMIDRNEGLTKTYNRFHDRDDISAEIARLRTLHAALDDAVLRAYGWPDLAERATAEFIAQDEAESKVAKTRLDWPLDFKEEVLARLLALNARRAAHERASGLTVAPEDDTQEIDEAEERQSEQAPLFSRSLPRRRKAFRS